MSASQPPTILEEDESGSMKREGPAVSRPSGFKRLKTTWKPAVRPTGGFLEFQAAHPSLCETRRTASLSSGNYKCPPLTSISQPCLPVANVGPTKVLPFLYIGSQQEALDQGQLQQNGITYILNVSNTCPKPDFIQEGHFLRIPVNDNYCDKLIPFFHDAFQFIDKVKEANGSVLIHCLAGISRSPTIAIAYIMKHTGMSADDTYRYVKDKRPTISPNFNFLGQLMEFEKLLKEGVMGEVDFGAAKKQCLSDLCSPTSPKTALPRALLRPAAMESKLAQSPSTALANLTFGAALAERETKEKEASPFPTFPTTSLDKLSFTPCLASSCIKEESPIKGATKRPLSTTTLEDYPNTEQCSSVRRTSPNTRTVNLAKVPLRSPQLKAKRPSVRPNSIAFSSYPKFELSSDTSDMRPLDSQPQLMDSSLKSPEKTEPTPLSEAIANFEQGRKSRSLEDILNNPEQQATMCNKCGGLSRLGNTAFYKSSKEVLSSFEKRLCHCYTADPHQSSSSISSSGSHNSLHGSLEIIQVS